MTDSAKLGERAPTKPDWIERLCLIGCVLMAAGGHWSPWPNDRLFTIGLLMAVPFLIQWPKRMGIWK